MSKLLTSLAEIRSFKPCLSGWHSILSAHPHKTEEQINAQFPLVDCLESNSIPEVCWLLEKRKIEIQICVRFARMCADSVAHLTSVADAAFFAIKAADHANYAANFAADYAYFAVKAAYYAEQAVYYAADYATAAVVAVNNQKNKNKQFFIQCIVEWENQ